MKASAPQFTGLPKIQKVNTPIRTLINFTTAPSYKIAKKLSEIIKNNINIKNDHSLKNSLELINITKNFNMEVQYKLASVSYTHLDVYKRQVLIPT